MASERGEICRSYQDSIIREVFNKRFFSVERHEGEEKVLGGAAAIDIGVIRGDGKCDLCGLQRAQ